MFTEVVTNEVQNDKNKWRAVFINCVNERAQDGACTGTLAVADTMNRHRAWRSRSGVQETEHGLCRAARLDVPKEGVPNQFRACSVIFNPYGLKGIDTDCEGF
jgi:hypothetical protein